MLNEVNDQAGQHELVAENLTSAVTKEIGVLVKDFKEDRKRVCLFLFCFVFVFVFVFFLLIVVGLSIAFWEEATFLLVPCR